MYHNPMTEGKRSQIKLTTMNTKNVTLEQLAERFNQTVWVKGDLKRIYLNDEGYNTKKMSTKTFIFEKDGEFIVSCRIECPSQPYQWIQSQEEEVKEGVYSKIEDYIERILDPSIDAKEEAEWEEARIDREKIAAEKPVVIVPTEPIQPKEFIKTFEIGETLTHATWGNVIVISEDENTVTVDKQSEHKKLLKKFAPLSRAK